MAKSLIDLLKEGIGDDIFLRFSADYNCKITQRVDSLSNRMVIEIEKLKEGK